MQQTGSIIIMCLVWGSACAVFYTKTSDNDYPRIGRRSFFTTINGNHYPRIGRRDASGSSLVLPGLEFNDLSLLDKRGVFTQGPHGSYPRVGRRSDEVLNGDEYVNESNTPQDKTLGVRADDLDTNNRGSSRVYETMHPSIPLEIMFFVFDVDSDGTLSKDEFVSGLSSYRHHVSL